MTEPTTYFQHAEYLAIALGRRALTPTRAAVAMFVAMNCKGTSGVNATVGAGRIAAELDISERQVWRHVAELVADGWFEQTQKPTRGSKGHPGRRARYRLTVPHIFTSPDSTVFPLTSQRDEVSHETPVDNPAETSDDFQKAAESSDVWDPNRLTLSAQSHDIATPENVSVLRTKCSTSDGTANNSSRTQPKDARETPAATARRKGIR